MWTKLGFKNPTRLEHLLKMDSAVQKVLEASDVRHKETKGMLVYMVKRESTEQETTSEAQCEDLKETKVGVEYHNNINATEQDNSAASNMEFVKIEDLPKQRELSSDYAFSIQVKEEPPDEYEESCVNYVYTETDGTATDDKVCLEPCGISSDALHPTHLHHQSMGLSNCEAQVDTLPSSVLTGLVEDCQNSMDESNESTTAAVSIADLEQDKQKVPAVSSGSVVIKERLQSRLKSRQMISNGNENNAPESSDVTGDFKESLIPSESQVHQSDAMTISYRTVICHDALDDPTVCTQKHMTTSSATDMYLCLYCLKEFRKEKGWSAHLKTCTLTNSIVVARVSKHRCLICQKIFEFEDVDCFRKHIVQCADKPYYCHICSKRFPSHQMLQTHQAIHSKKQTQSWTCSEHDPPCFDKASHDRHIQSQFKVHKCETCSQKFHCVVVAGKDALSAGKDSFTHAFTKCLDCERREKTIIPPKYKCILCTTAVNSEYLLDIHNASSHTYHTNMLTESERGICLHRCNTCGAGFVTLKQLSDHKLVYEDNLKKFHCNICNEHPIQDFLLTGPDFHQHLKTHKPESIYTCFTCSSIFAFHDALVIHILKNSSCFKMFAGKECRICGHSCRTFRFAIDHCISNTCQKCRIHFMSSFSLVQHIEQKHFFDKYPFKVDDLPPCKSASATKGDKVIGITQSTGNTQTEAETINVVDSQSIEQKNLEAQQAGDCDNQVTQMLGCSTCKKYFANRDQLKRHQTSYVNDGMKFSCPICIKTKPYFYKYTRAKLHSHLGEHFPEQIHMCNVCSSVFSQLSWLCRHLCFSPDCTRQFRFNKCPLCPKYTQCSLPLVATHFYQNTCSVCGLHFFRDGDLAEHQKKHLVTDQQRKEPDRPVPKKLLTDKSVIDDHCKCHFVSLELKMSGPEFVCSRCSKKVTLSERKRVKVKLLQSQNQMVERSAQTEKRLGSLHFKCIACSLQLESFQEMIAHSLTHNSVPTTRDMETASQNPTEYVDNVATTMRTRPWMYGESAAKSSNITGNVNLTGCVSTGAASSSEVGSAISTSPSAPNYGEASVQESEQSTPSRPELKCIVCGKCLPSVRDLIVHNATHRKLSLNSKPGKLKQCGLCCRTFNHRKELKEHMNLSHTTEESTPDRPVQDEDASSDQPIKTLKRIYKCAMCGLFFPSTDILLNHIRKSNCCDRSFPSSVEQVSVRDMLAKNSGVEHQCEYCTAKFEYRFQLGRHMGIHWNVGPSIQCPHCPMTFTQKGSMSRHLAVHQGGAFLCGKCGVRFKDKDLRKQHKCPALSLAAPYFCDICSKTFKRLSSVSRHKKIHRSAVVFECDMCGTAYPTRDILREHVCSAQERESGTAMDVGESFVENEFPQHSVEDSKSHMDVSEFSIKQEPNTGIDNSDSATNMEFSIYVAVSGPSVKQESDTKVFDELPDMCSMCNTENCVEH